MMHLDTPHPPPSPFTTEQIGFIGAGNMGEAMMGAVIRSGLVPSGQVLISDPRVDHCRLMVERYGVAVAESNTALFAQSDLIILAVKPQLVDPVLTAIAESPNYGVSGRKRLVSIAAGVRLAKLEAVLYPALPPSHRTNLSIIRVMPNTPALIGEGISGMSANSATNDTDLTMAQAVLASMGQVRIFDERMLDAVTAVSGSGPAYVFYLAEAMLAGAESVGLPPEDAAALVRATLKGAVALWNAGEDSPEQLRKRVTSPGGTTEAAIGVLETHQVRHHVAAAIAAAARRANELSG